MAIMDKHLKHYTTSLLGLYSRFGSWQKVADALGGEISKATWRDAAYGRRRLPAHAENALRVTLGYAPRRSTRIWQWSAETMKRYLRERGEVRL